MYTGEIIREFPRNKRKFTNQEVGIKFKETENKSDEKQTRKDVKERYGVLLFLNENKSIILHSLSILIKKNFCCRGCKKWGVVTTIYGSTPSEAIRRFLYRRKKWCVVVVGDKGTPDEVNK